MGLDTSHDCWHGSYGGFSNFRDELAKAAGIDISEWFEQNTITNEQLLGHWGDEKPEYKNGIYDTAQHDPLLYLLLHQDCEGELEWRYLGELKESLEKLRDSGFEFSDYTREHLDQFIEGLGRAIDYGNSVNFG